MMPHIQYNVILMCYPNDLYQFFLSSVVSNRPDFLDKLILEQGTKDVLPSQKMKLLNINAVAKHLTTSYDGPFLNPDSTVNNCPLVYRKSKKILIQGLFDTLKNLFTTDSYIRTEYDTKLGFVIGKYWKLMNMRFVFFFFCYLNIHFLINLDAECVLNENRMPLAVESTEKNAIRYYILKENENTKPKFIQ